MSDIPGDLLYTEDHEYVKSTSEDGVYLVGITDYAQGELGDVVFVELPKVGQSFGRKDTFGTVEAVKAVSDLYLPIGGEIIAVNDSLSGDPSVVNSDPYGDGWMVKVRASDASEIEQLLGPEEYGKHVGDG
jgi:glycine cleavage system H protein